MIRSETCVEAAVRMAVGLFAIGLGHLGGTFVGSLFPDVGALFYTISVLPFLVAGLYAVTTGLWIVVEGATGEALERNAASLAVAAASDDSSSPEGDGSTDDSSSPEGDGSTDDNS